MIQRTWACKKHRYWPALVKIALFLSLFFFDEGDHNHHGNQRAMDLMAFRQPVLENSLSASGGLVSDFKRTKGVDCELMLLRTTERITTRSRFSSLRPR